MGSEVAIFRYLLVSWVILVLLICSGAQVRDLASLEKVEMCDIL